jgi:hypothetical protein
VRAHAQLPLTVLALLLSLLGCGATCADACAVVASCGDSLGDFPNTAECEEACASQRSRVDGGGDTGIQGAFQRELDCLADATCEAIASGTCYEERVWSY